MLSRLLTGVNQLTVPAGIASRFPAPLSAHTNTDLVIDGDHHLGGRHRDGRPLCPDSLTSRHPSKSKSMLFSTAALSISGMHGWVFSGGVSSLPTRMPGIYLMRTNHVAIQRRTPGERTAETQSVAADHRRGVPDVRRAFVIPGVVARGRRFATGPCRLCGDRAREARLPTQASRRGRVEEGGHREVDAQGRIDHDDRS